MRDRTPSRPARPARAARRWTGALALAAATALGSSACAFDTGDNSPNADRPDPESSTAPVVRTPEPLGTGLPYVDPPLGNTLPGPTGGVPGIVPTTAPPASPGASGGADTDGGSNN